MTNFTQADLSKTFNAKANTTNFDAGQKFSTNLLQAEMARTRGARTPPYVAAGIEEEMQRGTAAFGGQMNRSQNDWLGQGNNGSRPPSQGRKNT